MEVYSKICLQEFVLEDAEWINLAQDKWQAHVNTRTSLRDP